MATLPFHLLDVFTTGAAMTGNQLLVVEDKGDTLTDTSMLAIAKEIGFAESAFVRSSNVRIFTIDMEVPQAGHPVLGLAEIVAGAGLESGGSVTLVTKKGPITVRFDSNTNTNTDGTTDSTSDSEGDTGTGRWTASQDPAEWWPDLAYTEVAARLHSTQANAITGGVGVSFPVGSTCGLKYALVPVASEEALDTLVVDPSADPMPDPDVWLYFYHRTAEDAVRTRMFCHEGGGPSIPHSKPKYECSNI